MIGWRKIEEKKYYQVEFDDDKLLFSKTEYEKARERFKKYSKEITTSEIGFVKIKGSKYYQVIWDHKLLFTNEEFKSGKKRFKKHFGAAF